MKESLFNVYSRNNVVWVGKRENDKDREIYRFDTDI